MAFTQYTASTSIIGNLGTDPEDRPDLNDQGFKDKFDENTKNFVEFFNDTHLPEVQEAKVSFVDDTASRTLALTDKYKKLRASHASTAINYTVPPNSSVAFAIGDWIIIEMTGAAQVAVVAGSGVTINPETRLKINGQYSSAALIKEASDTWTFQGSTKV